MLIHKLIWCRFGQSGDVEADKDDSRHSFEGLASEHSKAVEQGRDDSRFSFEGFEAGKGFTAGHSTTAQTTNHLRPKSPGEAQKITDPDNAQWQNVFPAYLQSKEDESDGDNDEIVQVT